MKLLFSGGGTLGSVTPLLAIIDNIKKTHPNDEIFWVTTKDGLEKDFLSNLNIKKYSITSAKLRRYFSLQNFLDMFRFIRAFFESYKIIKNTDPNIIISAGSYISVPLVFAGKLLKKKILIHQQDIKIGLANKIMSFFADKITLSFPESKTGFKNKKTYITGNPCRFTKEQINELNREYLLNKYNFKSEKPIILILGGSSGSEKINKVIYNSVLELTKHYQIIHTTGLSKGKSIEHNDYYQFEFLRHRILDFMFLADIIVSRAGCATLTELSFLEKCSIIIPLQGHQEYNADYFFKKQAVEIYKADDLIEKIFELGKNKQQQKVLKKNISNIMPNNGTENIIKHIYELK